MNWNRLLRAIGYAIGLVLITAGAVSVVIMIAVAMYRIHFDPLWIVPVGVFALVVWWRYDQLADKEQEDPQP